MSTTHHEILGVVLLARHGDRLEFFQDPLTYAASDTTITPLGNVQEFELGGLLRSMYMENHSPFLIRGISTGLFDEKQAKIRADASDEGGVIYDSALSLVQGLWPPTISNNVTLANGTVVVAPLHGYQYVPVESVDADKDVSLEGWVDCGPFNEATAAFYDSSLFKKVANDNADFLQSLKPFVDGRSVSLENMWNIFDYMNVQSIHNATFVRNLPDGFLARARALANFHENGVFASPQLNGIGNIAGRAILPSIVDGLNRIADSSDPLKFFYEAISYKPFLSLFNMTGLTAAHPELAAVVNYAAAAVFELRAGSSAYDPLIRFKFKNGTDDNKFRTFNLFGQTGDVPLSFFKSKLLPAAINNTEEWRAICRNNERGCLTIDTQRFIVAVDSSTLGQNSTTSSAVGAAVAVTILLAILCVLKYFRLISIGRKADRSRFETGSTSNEFASRSLMEKVN